MVDWTGKFDLLLKRVKDSWMDMLPLSSMTEQQREPIPARHKSIKCRQTGRNQATLDPNVQKTTDNWYVTHVASHASLFLFSDNLTTLLFIVGKDPDEARRERLTNSLFLRNITVTTYTRVPLFVRYKMLLGRYNVPRGGAHFGILKTFFGIQFFWGIQKLFGEYKKIVDPNPITSQKITNTKKGKKKKKKKKQKIFLIF